VSLGVEYERLLRVPERLYDAHVERTLLLRAGEAPHVLYADVDDDFWVWLHTRGVERHPDLRELVRTTVTWRAEASRLGIGDLNLARVESFWDERDDPRALGFDVAIEFQPDGENLPSPLRSGRALRLLGRVGLASPAYRERLVMAYPDLVAQRYANRIPDIHASRASPRAGNSPRRPDGGGWIFSGSPPEL
jgi:hypothetical protein